MIKSQILFGANGRLVHKENRAVAQAGAAEQVAVPVEGLDERLAAVRAFEKLVLPVYLLVLDHIAQLGGLQVALEADEHLVGAPGLLVRAVVLREAHMAGIFAVAVALALLDHFLGADANCRVRFILIQLII